LVLAKPVHGPQFNGKQEGLDRHDPPNLRCPRNGKQTSQRHPSRLRFHLKPLAALKQAAGKVVKVASASPDTGQPGDLSQGRL